MATAVLMFDYFLLSSFIDLVDLNDSVECSLRPDFLFALNWNR